MSMKTLPLLFINLGGEMSYILDQRLKAQNIPPEKAKKVMHDITGTMLNKRFMEELFKPQELYSKKAMRTVFDRLAHASIMRLNSASMDKLYDLMTMAFKYQISLCLRPKDILLVTLNHMDAIRTFVEGGSLQDQVDNVYKLILQTYGSIHIGEFMLIRQTLLNFFQDMHIRVSIFLKDKVQGSNGRFILSTESHVPTGVEVPGSIKLYDGNGKASQTAKFNPIGKFKPSQQEGSFDVRGDRVITLGTNMYSVARPIDTTIPKSDSQSSNLSNKHSGESITSATPAAAAATAASSSKEPDYAASANPSAKRELDLLSKLIGGEKQQKTPTDFRLNLFSTDEEEAEAAVLRTTTSKAQKTMKITNAQKRNTELDKIMGEMSVSGASSKHEDLLDLMDSTQKKK